MSFGTLVVLQNYNLQHVNFLVNVSFGLLYLFFFHFCIFRLPPLLYLTSNYIVLSSEFQKVQKVQLRGTEGTAERSWLEIEGQARSVARHERHLEQMSGRAASRARVYAFFPTRDQFQVVFVAQLMCVHTRASTSRFISVGDSCRTLDGTATPNDGERE